MDASRLEEIPLFAPLSPEQRGRVASFADELEVSEGTKLVREGDLAWEFFVIEEGHAQVLREDGRHVADLGPGDFVGEIAAIDHSRRRASVTSKSPMKLIVMTDYDFRSMASELPGVAAEIRAAIEQREPLLTC